MPRMLLTQETREKIRELRPIVEAANKLMDAFDTATEYVVNKAVDEHDESARDLAHQAMEDLISRGQEIAAEYGMEIRFNRTDGQFVLLDRTE